MIQVQTMLQVADNTGAKSMMAIKILGGAGRRYARVGDVIVGVVKSALPSGTIKNHQVVKAVIVRTRGVKKRSDGISVRSTENAAVIINEKGEPVGTRIFGPVCRELREKSYQKIISLAQEVI